MSNLLIIPLKCVYQHPQVSEQHESNHIFYTYPCVVFVCISLLQWNLLISIQYIWFIIRDRNMRCELWIISLWIVYRHPQVSEQHESNNIVVFISTGGGSMYFIATMNLIDITTIVLVTHFRMKPGMWPMDHVIDFFISPYAYVWTPWIHPHFFLLIHGWLE